MHQMRQLLKKSILGSVIAATGLTTALVAHADPFDGFFAPDGGADASLQPVESLFEAIYEEAEGDSEGYARAFADRVDPNVASMQLFGSSWFEIDYDNRSVFLEDYPDAIAAQLQHYGIEDYHTTAMEPAEGNNEYTVSGELATANSALPTTWTVRVRGNQASIIRMETEEGTTLLLSEEAREVLDGGSLDLDRILEAMSR